MPALAGAAAATSCCPTDPLVAVRPEVSWASPQRGAFATKGSSACQAVTPDAGNLVHAGDLCGGCLGALLGFGLAPGLAVLGGVLAHELIPDSRVLGGPFLFFVRIAPGTTTGSWIGKNVGRGCRSLFGRIARAGSFPGP